MNENELTFGGREVAVKALVGSHNYNLNTPASDKDYKFFVLPTFNDLYFNKMFSNGSQSETLDYSAHDVRKLPELLFKANLNFVEVLFSKELTLVSELEPFAEFNEVFSTMNLVAFYHACVGTHWNKRSNLFKGTATTTPMVEMFGYDCKEACHALRLLYALVKFAETKSMQETLWFNENDTFRKNLLSLKKGEWTLPKFYAECDLQFEFVEKNLKGWFTSQPLNLEAKETAKRLVKDLVEKRLKGS